MLTASTGVAQSLSPNCTSAGSSAGDTASVLTADGSTVYFYSFGRSSGPGIYRESTAGGTAALVSGFQVDSLNRPVGLALSPDGSTLALSYARPSDTQQSIFTISTTSGVVTKLTASDQTIATYDWSPDGKNLLVMRINPNGPGEQYVLVDPLTGLTKMVLPWARPRFHPTAASWPIPREPVSWASKTWMY